MNILVVGGGAAGFFGAIRAATCNPKATVTILERGKEVLTKVKISGGGRCNLTHACFVPRDLVKFYPRGEKELLGPFHVFAPGDTVHWFESRGVPTKIEADGRMFPVSNQSQSVIDCLLDAARTAGVRVKTQQRVEDILPPSAPGAPWTVICQGESYHADRLFIATGSSTGMWDILERIGLKLVPPVPSLFSFNIKDTRIQDLPGLAVPMAQLTVEGTKLQASGPLLITHWGMSGPAILRLSAWGARELNQKAYSFSLRVNWINQKPDDTIQLLEAQKVDEARKVVSAQPLFGLPTRLWKNLVSGAGITDDKRWADLTKKELHALATELSQGKYPVTGKSTFKDEFVTSGGVDLKEIQFKTFECKRFPGLFLAGETLNIDAITGGFNFQAAWTGGWIAGSSMSE